MPSLVALVKKLGEQESLLDELSLLEVIKFYQFCCHLKAELALFTPYGSVVPPCVLPIDICELLMKVLGLPEAYVSSLWTCLQDTIWADASTANLPLSVDDMDQLDRWGKTIQSPSKRVAAIMLYPPVQACTRCSQPLRYSTISRYRVTHFSIHHGSRDAYTTSFLCSKCKIRFYPNYYVHEKTRIYYSSDVPAAIQIEDHAFISSDLCELFTNCMLFAWVSSQNCSNIFNHALSRTSPSVEYNSTLLLSSEQVSRSFFLNALLRESSEQCDVFIMSDKGDNDQRIKDALDRRNRAIIFAGQPERMHACGVCEHILTDDQTGEEYSLRAVVTDGITLGRPCCKVHNCENPLVNNRAHFCSEHSNRVLLCVFKDCPNQARPGHQTCSLAPHQSAEEHRKAQGKGLFQCIQRLRRIGHSTAYLEDSMATSSVSTEELEDISDAEEDDPVRKSDTGNREPKARFGRRRTHNEQLVVACCGIITGRVTMFGAEAISGDALKSIYRAREDLPTVIFYDNNCHLQAHLLKQGDTYFQNSILPVDVFHFKSKHKKTDKFCQRHCNPAQWKELVDADNKWRFNSSIAEQVNVWMGGYLAIVREMLPHHFDFFLDEMIKRRNQVLLERLRSQGKAPYRIPVHQG